MQTRGSEPERTDRPRIVIVGGGFAGLYAAKHLGKAGLPVTLLDQRNFQLFQPLLYQVATGSIPPGDISIPQRVVLRKYQSAVTLHAAATDLDPQRRVVYHEYGEVPYDILIVATGVEHHYFGRDEWSQFAPGLKTIEQAVEIRHRVFLAFERAELTRDPVLRSELMTFVVVGAGPTGVELAGAIAEMAHKTMVGDFRAIDPRAARILLIEGAPEVLPTYAQELRAAAQRHLQELGVTVLTQARVEDLGADYVSMTRGGTRETVRARTVLWAAGVRASAFGGVLARRSGAEADRGGRIKVNPDCSLPQDPDIFVLGDLARLTDGRGREVPGLAPAAIQQGKYVAKLLQRRLAGKSSEPFRYRDMGTMAVIGMNRAVGDLRWLRVTGIFGWFVWAFVHIAALIAPEQRIRVFVQWTWKYFTRREGDRLITGRPVRLQDVERHGSA